MKQIRHVYLPAGEESWSATGTHAIEVEDDAGEISRGHIADWDKPAFHPLGYVGFSNYWGDELDPTYPGNDAVPEVGKIWKLTEVKYTTVELAEDNNWAETVKLPKNVREWDAAALALALAGERSEQGPQAAPEEEGK